MNRSDGDGRKEDLIEINAPDREKVVSLRDTALGFIKRLRPLEEAPLIPADRKTKMKRDTQLKHRKDELSRNEAFVREMV
jgi:hypothetical protein